MNNEFNPKRKWITSVAIVLAVALIAFAAGILLFKTSVQASSPPIDGQCVISKVTASA